METQVLGEFTAKLFVTVIATILEGTGANPASIGKPKLQVYQYEWAQIGRDRLGLAQLCHCHGGEL